MDEDETETTDTTQTTQTGEATSGAPSGDSTTGGEGAGTGGTEQPTAPVVPEGYVPTAEVESARAEIETERTARTAAEEARTAAETARAEAEAARMAAESRVRSAEIREAARDLNFIDPADAERFIGADVTDFKTALTEVLKTKGYLAKPAEAPPVVPTSPTNPARAGASLPTFTKAQISDRAFWAQNKDAIMLAMREGRITD